MKNATLLLLLSLTPMIVLFGCDDAASPAAKMIDGFEAALWDGPNGWSFPPANPGKPPFGEYNDQQLDILEGALVERAWYYDGKYWIAFYNLTKAAFVTTIKPTISLCPDMVKVFRGQLPRISVFNREEECGGMSYTCSPADQNGRCTLEVSGHGDEDGYFYSTLHLGIGVPRHRDPKIIVWHHLNIPSARSYGFDYYGSDMFYPGYGIGAGHDWYEYQPSRTQQEPEASKDSGIILEYPASMAPAFVPQTIQDANVVWMVQDANVPYISPTVSYPYMMLYPIGGFPMGMEPNECPLELADPNYFKEATPIYAKVTLILTEPMAVTPDPNAYCFVDIGSYKGTTLYLKTKARCKFISYAPATKELMVLIGPIVPVFWETWDCYVRGMANGKYGPTTIISVKEGGYLRLEELPSGGLIDVVEGWLTTVEQPGYFPINSDIHIDGRVDLNDLAGLFI